MLKSLIKLLRNIEKRKQLEKHGPAIVVKGGTQSDYSFTACKECQTTAVGKEGQRCNQCFRQDCLHTIARLNGPNGQDIKSELQEYYGVNINDSKLYKNLDTIVEIGLVDKEKQGGRENRYTLTQQGNERINSGRERENQHNDI